MKRLIILLPCLLAFSSAFTQTNFVQVHSESPGFYGKTIEKAGTNGSYEALYFTNSSSNITQVFKNSESSDWPVMTTAASADGSINASTGIKSFMYNGKPTIAYKTSGNNLVIAQWNSATNQYSSVVPVTLYNMYMGNFDVKVNLANGQLYVVYEQVITTTSLFVTHYDGSAWVNDLTAYDYNTAASKVTPQLHFKDDTLYVASLDPTTDTLFVAKQHYSNCTNTSMISVAFASPADANVNGFVMEGMPSQEPYFATYNTSTGDINLLTIENDKIALTATTNYAGLSAAKLDLFFNNTSNPVVAATTDVGGIGKSNLLTVSGSSLQNTLGDVEGMSGTLTLRSINGMQSADGLRYIVDVAKDQSGVSYARTYASNTMAVVSGSPVYDDTICYVPGADFNQTLLVNDITFSDAENDQVFIKDIFPVNYTSPNILQGGLSNFVVEQTQHIGGLTSYRISTVNIWDTGTTDLSIVFTDGYEVDTVTLTTIQSLLGANPPAPLVNNLSNITPNYCSNATMIDFKPVTNPYPGIFYADGNVMQNGLYPVSSYTGSEYFMFAYLDVATGCYANMDVMNPTALTPPTASVTATATTCDTNTGTAVLSYSTPGANLKDIYWTAGFHDSTSLSHLYAGQYVVTVTDSNNCIATATANVGVSDVTVSENIINAICAGDNNGSIQLTVNGPDAPYTFLWSNGKSTSGISNLAPGMYDVVIRSASGCEITKTYNITQPLGPVTINDYSPYPPDCGVQNGQLDANPTGGLAPYTFQWNTGATTQTISSLNSGIYHVKVSDVLGCSTEKDVVLNDYNTPGIFATSITKPSCGQNNGYIAAQLTDMSVFSSVSWNNGANTMFNGNLSPGYYVCKATTLSGCNAYKGWTLAASTPLQNNICMITVDSATSTNLLVWEKVENNVDHYNIYREGAVAGQFELIDTVSGLNHSIFNDVVASPRTRSWRYQISAVNQCGAEGPLSVPHKTIHLVIAQSIGNQYNISWDQYEGFSYSTVNLWRYTNVNGWELISALPSNIFSYTDNVSVDPTGLDYVIEITPPAPCQPDKAQDYNSTRSNKANCLFTPGSGTGASNNGITELEETLPIRMYPNPTTGQLNFINEGNEKTNVTVYNAEGKVLDQFEFTSEIQKNYQHLDAGIYFVRFQENEKVSIKKLAIN